MYENEQTVELLKKKNWHISFAESCTGGLCCARLVDVPSASYVLCASFVTYAESAKMKLVSVKEKTLQDHGVVSEEVAGEMAEGAAKAARCEVGVGISGVAGPSGGSKETPVGTVCFGFSINGCVKTFTKHFGNLGRSAVREAAVCFVFQELVRELSAIV